MLVNKCTWCTVEQIIYIAASIVPVKIYLLYSTEVYYIKSLHVVVNLHVFN
jgi:hypothetical protein